MPIEQGIDLTRTHYSEDQMTAWVIATRHPVIPGRYQLRSVSNPQIVDGWFSDGRWQIGYDGTYTPLGLDPLKFEWRGLNFDPIAAALLRDPIFEFSVT